MPLTLPWATPPAELLLAEDEVHVWSFWLDHPVAVMESLSKTLSADEAGRAERFYFAKDRAHFIAARGSLRSILGRYLGVEPGELAFCYGPYGKPALAASGGGEGLQFNLSHSQGLALLAVTRSRPVGVDLEYQRPDPRIYMEIAERFFTPGEFATLRSLLPALQSHTFFACWTRKEAYMKATGRGLSLSPEEFEVSLAPGEPALLATPFDPLETTRWKLCELLPAAGYIAALAVQGDDWRLHSFQWTGF